MMTVDSRKFIGRRFGISISAPPAGDPNWPPYYGDPAAVVEKFVFTEGSNFLFEGGILVLGHRWYDQTGQWNTQGILNHFIEKSREFRSFRPAGVDPLTGRTEPSIINILAWPDGPPPADQEDANRLLSEGILSIEQVKPDGIDAALLAGYQPDHPAPLHRYAHIRALTAMRRRLVEATDYRICIGGAFGKPFRRLSGVIEEALFTCEAGKPLYVSDAFGGASKALAECLLQRRVKFGEEESFYTPPAVTELMEAHSLDYPWASEIEGPSTRDGWSAFRWFQTRNLEEIASRAGLTLEQYCQVLAARDVETAMGWILHGLRKLTARK